MISITRFWASSTTGLRDARSGGPDRHHAVTTPDGESVVGEVLCGALLLVALWAALSFTPAPW